VRFNLNLSAQQIADPGLVPELVRRLRSERLDPALVALEAAEGAFLADPICTLRMVREAKAHGLRIALDDFGVGYSALGHVHELAFDELKIDGTLVRAMANDARTAALVGSIVHFANALEITAIAEGVETVDQLHALRRHGCRYGQGYLMTPALTADELAAVVVGPYARPSWAG
jgi:diguanylate cyclase